MNIVQVVAVLNGFAELRFYSFWKNRTVGFYGGSVSRGLTLIQKTESLSQDLPCSNELRFVFNSGG